MFNTLERFIKKFRKFSDNDEFTKRALRHIEWILSGEHEINVSKNQVTLYGKKLKVVLTLNKNEATFTFYDENSIENGSYLKAKENDIIKYSKVETNSYPINTKTNSLNITTTETIKVFDKYGYENYNRKLTKKENYYESTIDGSRKLREPDVMENYTETNYYWRTDDNYVISRCIKKYVYPDGTKAFIDLKNSDDSYMRFEKLDENDKKLDLSGYFYGFDKDLFIKYKNNEATTKDIRRNVYQKGYKIPPIEYI